MITTETASIHLNSRTLIAIAVSLFHACMIQDELESNMVLTSNCYKRSLINLYTFLLKKNWKLLILVANVFLQKYYLPFEIDIHIVVISCRDDRTV